jgi:hypothetical protein
MIDQKKYPTLHGILAATPEPKKETGNPLTPEEFHRLVEQSLQHLLKEKPPLSVEKDGLPKKYYDGVGYGPSVVIRFSKGDGGMWSDPGESLEIGYKDDKQRSIQEYYLTYQRAIFGTDPGHVFIRFAQPWRRETWTPQETVEDLKGFLQTIDGAEKLKKVLSGPVKGPAFWND